MRRNTRSSKHGQGSQDRQGFESADQAVFTPQFHHRHQRRRPGCRRVAVRGQPRRQGSGGDGRRNAGADSSDLGQGSRAVGGGLVGVGRAGDQRARSPRTRQGLRPDNPRGPEDVHRRAQRPDRVYLSRAARGPVTGFATPLFGHRGQRQQRRAAVRGDVPHRALRPGAVPLHQLRRSGNTGHGLGALVWAERVRGAGGGAVSAAVPPAERRSLLREPEPDGAADGVGRLRQQQPDVGGQPPVDALPGQPRDRVLQRRAGVHVVSHALRASAQWDALPRPLVQLPGRHGAVHLAAGR